MRYFNCESWNRASKVGWYFYEWTKNENIRSRRNNFETQTKNQRIKGRYIWLSKLTDKLGWHAKNKWYILTILGWKNLIKKLSQNERKVCLNS